MGQIGEKRKVIVVPKPNERPVDPPQAEPAQEPKREPVTTS